MQNDVFLELHGIAKSYGKKKVLESVTHGFPRGLTLLTGPSGAGKSTLLRLCATAEKPSAGDITWKKITGSAGRTAIRSVLGYAPQAVELPEDLTAREFAHHMAALKKLDIAAADAQFIMLAARVGLQGDIDRRISAYSGGMRRRLIFTQSLLGKPDLIALDEPTAELDSESAGQVVTLILEQAQAATVIMTTHLADQLSSSAVSRLVVRAGALTPAA
jgi:ABC-2 type transport system ATP-binding protein